MTAAGILGEDERIELIGGEIVPMSPKGNQHEVLKTALSIYWARRLPDDLLFTTETTFRLTPDTYLEPDFGVLSEGQRHQGPHGGDGEARGRDRRFRASAMISAARRAFTPASAYPSYG